MQLSDYFQQLGYQTQACMQRLTHNLVVCQCQLCHMPLPQQGRLCDECLASLPRLSGAVCKSCALPIAAIMTSPSMTINSASVSTESQFCGQCLAKPSAISQCHCLLAYQTPIDSAIKRFKDHRELSAGHWLSQQLGQDIATQYTDAELPELIIPVPIHWQKRLARGFNQTELIAETLANAIAQQPSHARQPLICANIIEHKSYQHSQRGLDKQHRLKNLRRVFQIKAHHKHLLQGKTIALVDDVMTTGATFEALAKLLRKSGACDVHAWALARVL